MDELNSALTDRIHRIAELKYPSPDLRDVLVRTDTTVKMVIVHNRKASTFELGPANEMAQLCAEPLEKHIWAKERRK